MVHHLRVGSLIVLACVCARGQPQPVTSAAAPPDALSRGINGEEDRVQAAKAKAEEARGRNTHYKTRWDLSFLPEYRPSGRVAGTLRIWGLGTLASGELAKDWEEEFRRYHPEATFEWHLPTAVAGMSSLITGAGDLGAFDKLPLSEARAFQRLYSRDPVELPLATGAFDVPGWASALGVFVNPDNPLARISIGQLDGVFGAARSGGWVGTSWHTELGRGADQDIRSWGQLGLTGAWADMPIDVHGPEPRSEESLQFADAVLRGGDKWSERLHLYSDRLGPDGRLILASEQIAEALAQDRYGLAYFANLKTQARVKPLAVAEQSAGAAVPLTIDTVQDRTYPLCLTEHWYLNPNPGQPLDPRVREFLRYVLSREGQGQVERDGKYLPLTPELVEAGLEKINQGTPSNAHTLAPHPAP